MSSGGELGSGGFFGQGPGASGPSGGGLLGSALGGFFGQGAGPGGLGPQGSYGLWPSCGCSTIFIILAGMFLVCGGCLRMVGQ
jgi:hypothetical protein